MKKNILCTLIISVIIFTGCGSDGSEEQIVESTPRPTPIPEFSISIKPVMSSPVNESYNGIDGYRITKYNITITNLETKTSTTNNSSTLTGIVLETGHYKVELTGLNIIDKVVAQAATEIEVTQDEEFIVPVTRIRMGFLSYRLDIAKDDESSGLETTISIPSAYSAKIENKTEGIIAVPEGIHTLSVHMETAAGVSIGGTLKTIVIEHDKTTDFVLSIPAEEWIKEQQPQDLLDPIEDNIPYPLDIKNNKNIVSYFGTFDIEVVFADKNMPNPEFYCYIDGEKAFGPSDKALFTIPGRQVGIGVHKIDIEAVSGDQRTTRGFTLLVTTDPDKDKEFELVKNTRPLYREKIPFIETKIFNFMHRMEERYTRSKKLHLFDVETQKSTVLIRNLRSGYAYYNLQMDLKGEVLLYQIENQEGESQYKMRFLSDIKTEISLPDYGRGYKLSPDGTQIAFTKDDDLYIAPINMSSEILFAENIKTEGAISWSLDGTYLIYAIDEFVFIHNTKDSTRHSCTTGVNPFGYDSSHYALSPDNTKLVYLESLYLSIYDLEKEAFTDSYDAYGFDGAMTMIWSPDSTRFIVRRDREVRPPMMAQIFNIETEEFTPLVTDEDIYYDGRFASNMIWCNENTIIYDENLERYVSMSPQELLDRMYTQNYGPTGDLDYVKTRSREMLESRIMVHNTETGETKRLPFSYSTYDSGPNLYIFDDTKHGERDVMDVRMMMACPFIYVFNGTEYVKDVEIIQNLNAKSLETTQRVRMFDPVIIDGVLTMEIREEKEEISYIDSIRLVINGVEYKPDNCPSALVYDDSDYLVLQPGEVKALVFSGLPESDEVYIDANGYYIPQAP